MNHEPSKLAEVRSRRIRAGRAIVQPIGRPDCLFATSGPAPLGPTPEELGDEALYAYLKSKEPKAAWWERAIVAALAAASGALVLYALIHLAQKAFS
jgi:hypothetical protein